MFTKMSSAALQSALHQPTSLSALNAHSPSVSPSNRQYTPAQSPNREGRYANREQLSASPGNSSKRTSTRPSGNSANATSPVPAYLDQSQPTMTSRTTLASPAPVMAASAEYEKPPSGRRRHDPPVAPPRTSSTQYGNTGSGQSAGRRVTRAEERAADSPRRTPGEDNKMSSNGYPDTQSPAYDESNSRTSRTGPQHAPQAMLHASEDPRDQHQTAPTTMPVRTRDQQAASVSSKQPSREASEVLNRVIVSQPEVDLEREKERREESKPHGTSAAYNDDDEAIATPPVVHMHELQDESRRGGRSRHEHSKREKSSRFGDYYLGNTIGEGEFGKVKLGWNKTVASSVGNNPSRLTKIYREVSILRGLSHPNIVRLHEMSETERHIGIVLEYASGGELFDYILNHRYLKDQAARRLFAQLISGVGYLHKKGIVHRDLKLENLLLDRNRNIIITDFGFANTFDAADELTEEEELNLPDRDFVKRTGLDKTKPNGMRRGDLMQTSCGSPCYAAPELVVSDSLYTGRKVDVWSCGVILYAMLAGYLPFDDDPDNPEGDNINLLYKYIVNTPLTFPEYVTPHARDLLRRILVPSPRKRADLFEVARHSWLSEYAHVVELITSTTTTSSEIQNTTVPSDEVESGGLARSASVREQTKTKATTAVPVGDLARKQGKVDADEVSHAKQQRDNKRRTVQVEYVAPTTQTQRGADQPEAQTSSHGKSKGKSASQGPADIQSSHDKPLPKDPPLAKDPYAGSSRDSRKPPSAQRRDVPPPRSSQGRSTSDHAYMSTSAGPSVSRPATGGSIHSSGSRGLVPSSRASYGLPLPPAVAGTNAQGSIQQPKGSKNYVISNPIPQDTADLSFGRPSMNMPPKFAEVSGFNTRPTPPSGEGKGHRRSNTIGEIGGKIFGRSGSIFGARKKREGEKPSKKYPPVSMSNTIPGESRVSMDSRASRKSFTLGLGKKRSGSIIGSQASAERPPNARRFSIMKVMGLGKDPSPPLDGSQPDLPIQEPPEVDPYGRYANPPPNQSNPGQQHTDGIYEQPLETQQAPPQINHGPNPAAHRRYPSESQASAIPSYLQQGAVLNSESESSVDRPQRRPPNSAPYQSGYDSDQYDSRRTGNRQGERVLQKNKRFVDAYDEEEYGRPRDHAGSSGAAKRVMDFFRRRGRARGGEV
ncbi:hypothetical protein RRF57_008397 [Xylaria bambusicola]|uniref:non-specific serine/threonine protein kinase n=1 Tax=Xylaria bambusicola TaxID=326684 RepID=A0AAN7UMZ3_9PEZI